MKASTCSGLGGSPIRSMNRRRMRMLGSAGREGARPEAPSRSSTQASIGPRAHGSLAVSGSGVSRSGWSDHQSRPARFSVLKARGSSGVCPQGLPASSQARSSAFSAAGSGWSGGISSPSTRCQRRLSVLPGSRAGPLSPPLAAAAASMSDSPPSGSSPEWHSRQRETRSGAICRSKSTAGSCGSSAAAPSAGAIAAPIAIRIRVNGRRLMADLRDGRRPMKGSTEAEQNSVRASPAKTEPPAPVVPSGVGSPMERKSLLTVDRRRSRVNELSRRGIGQTPGSSPNEPRRAPGP